jgi:putative ATPase
MQKLWNVISQRCTDETGLRLLISYAGIGPAEALLQLLESKGNNLAERELLAPLIALEHTWLESQRLDVSLAQNLQELGWQLELEQWEEPLSLQLDEDLEHRWLSEGRPYRELIAKTTSPENLNSLQGILRSLRGKKLPQRLIHQRIIGSLEFN